MNPSDPHILLLTGYPGVGKTTVVRRVAEAKTTGTFYRADIRDVGEGLAPPERGVSAPVLVL